MINNLEELSSYVTEKYRITPTSHPRLLKKGYSPQELQIATIKHNLLHFNKRNGEIAALLHDYDHGNEIDVTTLKETAVKMMVELLKFSEAIGIESTTYYTDAPKLMSSK